MKRFLQVFYIFFSSLIFSLSIPNFLLKFGSPILGMIALIPLYIAISRCQTYKEASFFTALQIMFTHLLSSFWLANFKDFAIFTLGASAIGTACIGAFFGLILFFPYANFNTSRLKEKNPAFNVLYFSAVWVIWEWTKSNGFLGYPWGTLSMSVWNAKCLMQIADITGAFGITFLMALFSAFCAEGLLLIEKLSNIQQKQYVTQSYKNISLLCLSLYAISIFYGAYQIGKKRTPTKYLNTVLVQQNLDPWAVSSDEESISISQKLTEDKINQMKEKHISTDLVVWSEAVLRMPFPNAQNYYRIIPEKESLMNSIERMNVPFIIGAPYTFDKKKGLYGNGAILIDKKGNYRGAYNKIHLVPFAEVIPGIEFRWIANLMNSLVGFSNGWKAGEQFVLFDIPCHANPEYKSLRSIISAENKSENKTTVKISTPICFEDAFPSVCKELSKTGCELFVNLTDDSWSLTESAEYQHFVIAALRSIEFRLPMLRSTNSGYTVILDPTAKILADLPLFTEQALSYQIPIFEKQITVYERFGNFFVYCCMIFIFLAIISYKNEKR